MEEKKYVVKRRLKISAQTQNSFHISNLTKKTIMIDKFQTENRNAVSTLMCSITRIIYDYGQSSSYHAKGGLDFTILYINQNLQTNL
jgi:hypothetical protein